MAEIHVQHLAALLLAQRRDPPPGVVDQLVRAGQDARAEVVANAADGVQREHAGGAQLLQRGQVGAVIDLVRRDRMPFAMARQAA